MVAGRICLGLPGGSREVVRAVRYLPTMRPTEARHPESIARVRGRIIMPIPHMTAQVGNNCTAHGTCRRPALRRPGRGVSPVLHPAVAIRMALQAFAVESMVASAGSAAVFLHQGEIVYEGTPPSKVFHRTTTRQRVCRKILAFRPTIWRYRFTDNREAEGNRMWAEPSKGSRPVFHVSRTRLACTCDCPRVWPDPPPYRLRPLNRGRTHDRAD